MVFFVTAKTLFHLKVTDEALNVPCQVVSLSCLLQDNLLFLPNLLHNVVAPQVLHFPRALVVLVVVTDVPETPVVVLVASTFLSNTCCWKQDTHSQRTCSSLIRRRLASPARPLPETDVSGRPSCRTAPSSRSQSCPSWCASATRAPRSS